MPNTREIEAKFLLQGEAARTHLARLQQLGTFRLLSKKRERQRNRYLDTQDHQLRKKRAALKLREVDRRAELTFKSEVGYRRGVSERVEVTVPIRKAQLPILLKDKLKAKPIRCARDLIGSKKLAPVLTLLTNRRKLLFGSGRQRIELDLDRVTVMRGNRKASTHWEAELEQINAPAAAYRRTLTALQRQLGRGVKPFRLSKYEMGYRLLKAYRKHAG